MKFISSTKSKRVGAPLMAAAIGLLGIALVFWSLRLAPFGTKSLLFSDFGTQYVPFATYFRGMLKQGLLPLYTFAQGLGDNFVPTMAYYLISPFNLLLLAFPAAQVPVAMGVIIMLKVAAASGTMTWFLQRHTQVASWRHVWFGPAWGLSAFVAANYYNLMWLDTLVWLPLMVAGLDALVRRQRVGAYYGWLVMVIVTNYYLGFMSCLFAIMYVVYATATVYPDAPLKTWWHHPAIRARAWRFVAAAALAGLTSMAILIPTALGMTQTAKGSVRLSDYLPVTKYGLSMLAQLGAGASNYANHLHHGPTIFAGSLITLLAIGYFLHPHFTKAAKRRAAWLLGILLISTWFQPFNTIWHMGRGPAGFPFRQSFLVVFVALLLADRTALANPRRLPAKWARRLPWLLAAAILLGGAIGQAGVAILKAWQPAWLDGNLYYFATMPWGNAAIAAGFALLTGWLLFARANRGYWVALGVVLMAELGWNFRSMIGNSPFGEQAIYATAYPKIQAETQATQGLDRRFYRLVNQNYLVNDAFAEGYNNYNDAFLFNFFGISGYNSTLSDSQRLFLKNLGLFSRNERRLSAVGLSPISETLLGVKYRTGLDGNGPVVTQASGYVGMGFVVPTGFGRQPLRSGHVQANLTTVANALAPGQANRLLPAPTITAAGTTATGKHYRHQLTLTMPAHGTLYLASDDATVTYGATRVNGQKIHPGAHATGNSLLLRLGQFKAKQRVTVTVVDDHATATNAQQALTVLASSAYAKVVARAKRHAFRAYIRYHAFQPEFTNTIRAGNHQALYLTLPANPGWHATVNGRSVHMTKAFGAMLKVPLTRGENLVHVWYTVPGLKLGLALSGLGLLGALSLTIGLRVNERRRRHA